MGIEEAQPNRVVTSSSKWGTRPSSPMTIGLRQIGPRFATRACPRTEPPASGSNPSSAPAQRRINLGY